MSWKKGIIIGIVVIVLYGIVGLPLVAGAQETYGHQLSGKPTGTEILFDLTIARPLGFTSFVVGATIFIVAFPFVYVVGNAPDVADALIGEAYYFTFVRDLGTY
jgi:hypothetical protein